MGDCAPVIVTLTTDFGLQDSYAGQLRGAVLKGCPRATVIDLTHGIPPWDVVTAAVTIRTSFSYFPAGSIHLVVVDPGVGTPRPILVASGSDHFFVAPDNGILSLLVVDLKVDTVHWVEPTDHLPSTISPTFHGRGLMAPVAAALAAGRPLTNFGPAVDPAALTLISLPNVAVTDNCLRGQVQRLDHFGNVVTSLHAGGGPFSPERFDFVEIGGRRIAQLRRSYAEVAPCEMLALIGGDDYLEIAVNQGSAAEQLGCRPGDPVIVHLTRT